MKILLTSIGLTTKYMRFFAEARANENHAQTVVIITTANKLKSLNPLAIIALINFMKMGFDYNNIHFHDLETSGVPKIKADVLFVCGGNSFELLYHAKRCNFKEYILRVLKSGGLYIGSSAGSILLAPSVFIASQINPDIDARKLSSYEGLGITKVTIFPHYAPKYESQIQSFERFHGVSVVRLYDSQAAYCDEENVLKIL